jgi:hypothetical protein
VELLVRRARLQGVTGRPTDRRGLRSEATAGDLVNRQFAGAGRDQLWVTGITEHPTREGKLYCAVVLDACSRRVVGWSIDASPTAALVTGTLGMAIQSRGRLCSARGRGGLAQARTGVPGEAQPAAAAFPSEGHATQTAGGRGADLRQLRTSVPADPSARSKAAPLPRVPPIRVTHAFAEPSGDPSSPFVLSLSCKERAQVTVTGVTVADRWGPIKPGVNGRGIARRQVTLNAFPPGGPR